MGAKTGIEWTDATWTPIRARRKDNGKVGVACVRMSPACANCYASGHNRRNLPNFGTGLDFTVQGLSQVEIFLDEESLLQPLRWRRGRKIFVCNQTDLFGEFVDDSMIDRVFALMALCPQHTFQVLTKRSARMLQWFNGPLYPHRGERVFGEVWSLAEKHRVKISSTWPLSNVWLGVTAENQEWADKRIPDLLKTPAAKRFISAEPLLGPINVALYLKHLDWVIAGGESGSKARPSHQSWFTSLQFQCQLTGIPFFFKQWGTFKIGSGLGRQSYMVLNDGRYAKCTDEFGRDTLDRWPEFDSHMMHKVGKKKAGALLQGREYKEFPA